MCGCGNNNGCTIILIILILKYLGLLDVCNPSSRNAITLLLLWWLCGNGKFFANSPYGNNAIANIGPCQCGRPVTMACCR